MYGGRAASWSTSSSPGGAGASFISFAPRSDSDTDPRLSIVKFPPLRPSSTTLLDIAGLKGLASRARTMSEENAAAPEKCGRAGEPKRRVKGSKNGRRGRDEV